MTCFLVSSVQLYDKYNEFVTPSEKDEFIARLQEVEDWLYEDGEDETKSVYIAKLKELKMARTLYFGLLFLAFIFFLVEGPFMLC